MRTKLEVTRAAVLDALAELAPERREAVRERFNEFCVAVEERCLDVQADILRRRRVAR